MAELTREQAEEAMAIAADELLRMKETVGWKFLVDQIRLRSDEAKADLAKVDPTDVAAIISLQHEAGLHDRLMATVDELIQMGVQESTKAIEDSLEDPIEADYPDVGAEHG